HGGQISNTPTTNGFTQIDAGAAFSIALHADGSVHAWGRDDQGQVSDAPPGNDFIWVACGGASAHAIRSNGTMVSWGLDDYGQVSNAPANDNLLQVGSYGPHGVALRHDGSIVSWGYDNYGQVSNTPNGQDFVKISAGMYHSFGLRNDGSIEAWGRNNHAQVIPPAGRWLDISGGYYHSVGIVDSVDLGADPIVAGGTATFHVAGGEANSLFFLAWSLQGIDPWMAGIGVQIFIANPSVLNPFSLDLHGAATFGPLPVPHRVLPGTEVWFQGVNFASGNQFELRTSNLYVTTVL
ncbi:MAG: hypothetical protein COB96_07150, partial [Planctomycetota bacterium]